MIGIPTALCLVVALGLRLNVPAIQAANYAAMPLQVALIFPFVRLGGWMFMSGGQPALNAGLMDHGSRLKVIWASGSLVGQALGAWFMTAIPMVLLMTLALTALLRRMPALAKAGSGRLGASCRSLPGKRQPRPTSYSVCAYILAQLSFDCSCARRNVFSSPQTHVGAPGRRFEAMQCRSCRGACSCRRPGDRL